MIKRRFYRYEHGDNDAASGESSSSEFWVHFLFFSSKLMDRVILVEYAIRDNDDKRNGYSPDRRGRDVSPDGRNYGRRAPSPYRRDRGNPDYGCGPGPTSRSQRRGSLDYGRRGSPDYGRDGNPINDRYESRSPPPRERS